VQKQRRRALAAEVESRQADAVALHQQLRGHVRCLPLRDQRAERRLQRRPGAVPLGASGGIEWATSVALAPNGAAAIAWTDMKRVWLS
jgi:hypothetical protein